MEIAIIIGAFILLIIISAASSSKPTNKSNIQKSNDDLRTQFKDNNERLRAIKDKLDKANSIIDDIRVKQLEAIRIEMDERGAMIVRSSQIMDKTTNLSTLQTRYDSIKEHLDWFKQLEEEGCPYKITGGADNKIDELNKLYQERLFIIYENAKTESDLIFDNKILINADQFNDKYIKYASMSIDLMGKLNICTLNGYKYAVISLDEYNKTLEKFNYNEEKDKQLKECVRTNLLGKQLEKEGNITEAIEAYEQNLLTEFPATLSYERLPKIYRKMKDYANEIRVLDKAIEVFTKENERRQKRVDELGENCVFYDIQQYIDRKEKAKTLLEKSSK